MTRNISSLEIKRFWQWFATEASRLNETYERKDFEKLTTAINNQLDLLSPDLAWEMGPGKEGGNVSFTISGEGDPALRAYAENLIASSPQIPGWEFYSARQARPAPAAIQLPERGLRVPTANWRFIAEKDLGIERIHLVILDDLLSSIGREPALRAVSLFLDSFLGEDQVERWIGKIDVRPLDDRLDKSYKISDLPDYVHWVTTKEFGK